MMGFLVFLSFFVLRVKLSVTILAMVNATYLRQLEADERDDNSSTLRPRADDDNNVRNVGIRTGYKCNLGVTR